MTNTVPPTNTAPPTTPRPALAITATGLRKSYGGKPVLDGIDLRVPAGTVFAMLGPNGAGKTTTVRILSTLIAADGGRASVAGHDLAAEPGAVRAAIGVTGQFSAVDNLLSARENLILMADLYHLGRRPGRRRAAELLDRFGLGDVAGQPISTYSGGLRRRLDLAMTLVGGPRVIFLDEPTTGLDPRSRRDLWTIVRELVAGGVTIFLTTQYLEEADQLADRIGVLDHGRMVAEGSAAELKRLVPGGHITVHVADPSALAAAAAALGATAVDEDALTAQVPSDQRGISGDSTSGISTSGGRTSGNTASAVRSVLDRLDAAGIAIADLSVHTPDLDDVFLALTGER
jgi:ABC-2 type transport system ATP-binding protein